MFFTKVIEFIINDSIAHILINSIKSEFARWRSCMDITSNTLVAHK